MKAASDEPSQMGAYLLVSAILRGLSRMPHQALRPNPSLKRSANGKPPAACRRRPPGSHVMLLFLAPATRRIPGQRWLEPATRRGGAVVVRTFARLR